MMCVDHPAPPSMTPTPTLLSPIATPAHLREMKAPGLVEWFRV